MKRYIRNSDSPYFIEKNGENLYSVVREDDLEVISDSHESYEDAKAEMDRLLKAERTPKVEKDANKDQYVVYAEGLESKGNKFYWTRSGGGKWRTEAGADKFTKAEAEKLEKMNGKYRWIKKKVTSSIEATIAWTGEPDSYYNERINQLADQRLESRIHSWRDAYKEFEKIENKYFPDVEKIDEEVNKLYFRHSKNPYFQEAWKRWGDSGADPEELEDIDSSVNVDSLLKGDAVVVQTSDSELHPVIFEKYKENDTFLGWDWKEYLRRFFLVDIVYHAENFQDAVDYIDRKDGVTAAVKTKVKPFVVTYMYDDGDAENGPHPYGGEDLVYAEDEDEACRQWEEYCDADRLDGYAGCNARPATPEDVNRLEAEKKDYGIMDPVSSAVDVEYYDLPNSLYMFLQDVAQETGAFEYGDLRNVALGVTEDEKRILSNFKRRYYRAAENQDEKKCNKIGGEIADWLFTLK